MILSAQKCIGANRMWNYGVSVLFIMFRLSILPSVSVGHVRMSIIVSVYCAVNLRRQSDNGGMLTLSVVRSLCDVVCLYIVRAQVSILSACALFLTAWWAM